MDLKQFKKASKIKDDITDIQKIIDNYYSEDNFFYKGRTFVTSLEDKEAQEAIITTLKEQVDRLQVKFDSIK